MPNTNQGFRPAGKELRERLRDQEITLRELGRRIGYTERMIQYIVAGERFPSTLRQALIERETGLPVARWSETLIHQVTAERSADSRSTGGDSDTDGAEQNPKTEDKASNRGAGAESAPHHTEAAT